MTPGALVDLGRGAAGSGEPGVIEPVHLAPSTADACRLALAEAAA